MYIFLNSYMYVYELKNEEYEICIKNGHLARIIPEKTEHQSKQR